MVDQRTTDSHASRLSNLGNDVPLSDPAEDGLHRRPFAEHLADSILAIDPIEGFVFALTGPWGSGKTTILNFTERLLKDKTAKRVDRLVIVHFNAWWVSGSDRFLQHFFKQFQLAFGGKESKKILKTLIKYAGALEPLPYIGPFAAVFHWLGIVKATQEEDISNLHQEIDKKLRKFPGRILVVIDDIDRLRSEEIRLVFRLVKAVANFPQTIYLLVYDEPVVVRAVGGDDLQVGREYLNKIVQLPLVLPAPDCPTLREWFFQDLNKILEKHPEHLYSQEEFSSLYSEISRFLKTPRSIERFLNLLRATYPLVKHEVNAVDFIGIQALRQFAPTMYTFVANNKGMFCRATASEDENEWKYLDAALKYAMDCDWQRDRDVAENAVRDILVKLFPCLGKWPGSQAHQPLFQKNWLDNRRICSFDIFDHYFILGTPPGDVSEAEFQTIMSLVPEVKAFGDRLKKLASEKRPDGVSRLRVFLNRLEKTSQKIVPDEHIEPFLHAIYSIGDELVLKADCDEQGVLKDDTKKIIQSLAKKALKQLRTQDERWEVLDKIFRESGALFTMAFHVDCFGQEHEKNDSQQTKETDRTVGSDHLDKLKKSVVEHIRKVREESLQKDPFLGFILGRWADWADSAEVEKEVEKYVGRLIQNDKGLCDFLAGFLYLPEIKLEDVNDFITPGNEPSFSRCEDILNTHPPLEWLTDRHKKALRSYIDAVDAVKRETTQTDKSTDGGS